MGIFDVFNNDVAQDAANAQIKGLNNAYNTAQPLLQQGLSTANQTYASALAPFTQNLQQTQAGQTAYANATGANGQAGYAQALQDFQNQPGYQFALDQASQNVLRNQSQTGSLASGATDLALANQAQGMQNQQYQQYVQNLQPFVGASTQNAAGSAGVQTQQAATQNQNYGTQAQLGYTTQTGIGNANANAILAQNQANANQFNFGMQGAQLGAGLLGFL